MSMFSSSKLSDQGQRNFDIGNIYLERNDFENAVKYFNKALETDPNNRLILDTLNNLKNKVKNQIKEIDSTKTMILYTSKSINTDILNWYYENNYVIFSVGYGNNSWALCFLKNEASVKQRIYLSPQIPSQQIEQGWNDGYSITHACYGQNLWLIVSQDIESVGYQQWFYNPEFPEEEINSLYREGYQISICDYGDAWFIVMNERSNFFDQDFDFYDDYP